MRTQDPQQGLLPPREAIPEAWLDILDESIRHRGPDGQGRFRDRAIRPDGKIVDVAIVHRRLAIIDLSAKAAQPMVIEGGTVLQSPDPGSTAFQSSDPGSTAVQSCDPGSTAFQSCDDSSKDPAQRAGPPLISREGTPYEPIRAHRCPKCNALTAIAFNGCIYNHKELRNELQSLGHAFFTDHSDTEVLVHGWCEWGEDLWEHIEGMYALSVWDLHHSSISIARDPAGQKPVYYVHLGDIAAFASSPSPLFRLQGLLGTKAELDPSLLAEWIALGYQSEGTPFKGIWQVRQGTVLEFDQGVWADAGDRPFHSQPASGGSIGELIGFDRGSNAAVELVEGALRDAVSRHLDADVPVACFLSGGVDSSLIAHYVKEQVGDLATICVRMPSLEYDESAFAARAADAIGSDHHEIDVAPDPASDLILLVKTLGLPFGDSSLLPTFWVSTAAASQCGVALSGDGGDELFLGYERYFAAEHLVALWALGVMTTPLPGTVVSRKSPKSRADKLARLLTAASKRSYRSLLGIYQHPDLHRLTRGGRSVRWSDGAQSIRRAQVYDLDHHLPGDLLRKVDHASMSAALEVRAPMLDSIVAQAAMSIPIDRLLASGKSTINSTRTRKGLLKQVALKYLPPEIVNRPKQGFAIPIGEWFRSDYGQMRQLLYDHLESAEPFPGLPLELNMDFVRQMLKEHDQAGERSLNPWHGRDHSQRLYMLLVLSIWCKWLQGLRSE